MKTIQATLKDCLALKCLDCCCGDWDSVIHCSSGDCPLLSVRPMEPKDTLKAKYWSETEGRLKILPVLRSRENKKEADGAAAGPSATVRKSGS